ncbi:MAG TPA: amidohydrolase family protein [Natronosporangium sp.]
MSETRTLFTGGLVFDGTGSEPQPADVVIAGGRIVEIGTGLDGDHAVDCTGRAVLPGFFDCHVHLMVNGLDPIGVRHRPFSLAFYEAAASMRATLAAGITTVREAGGADLGVMEAQRRGLIAGPRMQIAIIMIHQTGGHGDPWEASGTRGGLFVPHPGRPSGTVDGPDEVRRKVRELVRAGATVIKCATSGGVLSPRSNPRHGHFRADEVTVMVQEAAAAGLAVMAHAQATDGIKTAVRAGVRSIEHGIYLDDEAIELMRERGTWLVPTLMAPRGVFAAAEAGVPVAEHQLAKARMVAEAHTDSVRRAIAAGVRVAMGTDSGVTPHGQNLGELPLLVDAGMTPAQALHATTLSAAQLMGLDDQLGSIAPGKRADLVIVDGDPLDVATLGDRIVSVYQDGVLVHQREQAEKVE